MLIPVRKFFDGMRSNLLFPYAVARTGAAAFRRRRPGLSATHLLRRGRVGYCGHVLHSQARKRPRAFRGTTRLRRHQ